MLAYRKSGAYTKWYMRRDVGLCYRYVNACQFRQGRREFLLTEGEDLGRKVGVQLRVEQVICNTAITILSPALHGGRLLKKQDG